jgi:hypothetical protein
MSRLLAAVFVSPRSADSVTPIPAQGDELSTEKIGNRPATVAAWIGALDPPSQYATFRRGDCQKNVEKSVRRPAAEAGSSPALRRQSHAHT